MDSGISPVGQDGGVALTGSTAPPRADGSDPRGVLCPVALTSQAFLPIEVQVESAESVWRPLGELLVDKGLVTEVELAAALAEQSASGRLLGAILVERGFVSGPALASALAEQCGVELATQGGFGTGLWAEIDRRHRAGRGRPESDDDNVVAFHPIRPPVLEAIPDPDPELERLAGENGRLQEELERVRGEFASVVEASQPEPEPRPEPASAHLLFIPTPARYLLAERDGPPPEPGAEVGVSEAEGRFVVARVGRAPFPAEPRPCAFLLGSPEQARPPDC
jgi:hypothetical protein